MPPAHPLRFAPLIKRTIWGGQRLSQRLGKSPGGKGDDAESWEVVDHDEDQSVVVGGELEGQSLGKLFAEHRGWLMGADWLAANPDVGSFPLLFKYLDCNRVLSVQVHPDDEQGAKLSPPDLGKTEAWYILETTDESVIYAGLRPGVDAASLRAAIDRGETESALHRFQPQTGDCVFIPAGTVHALGGGLLVAEIQQSSDTTYRLFDWNRTDAAGKSRPLHVEESLDVTDFGRGPVEPIRSSATPGIQSLVSCDKFELSVVRDCETTVGGVDRCSILSVIEGTATLTIDGEDTCLSVGDTTLLPAAMAATELRAGEAVVLAMSPASD